MEQDIKEEILKKIEKMGKGTILLHGGWGIGKTFLAKEYIYDQWEKKGKNVLYFDARGIEIYPSYQEAILTILQSFKDNKKRNLMWGLNARIWFVNGLLKTSFDYVKIKAKKTIVNIKTKNKEEIILIIDEIDRISGETILKVLNLINILKITYKEKVRVIAVGNKKEIKSVLIKSLGLEDENGFIEKYFDNEIDISEIERKAAFEILMNGSYSSLINLFKGHQNQLNDLKINPRKLERFLKGIKNIKFSLSNELVQTLFIYWLVFSQVKKYDFKAEVFDNAFQLINSDNEKLFDKIYTYDDLNFKINDFNIYAIFMKYNIKGIDIFKKLFSKYKIENFDAWYEWLKKLE